MPSRRSNKSLRNGAGAFVLLILLAAAMLYNAWEGRNGANASGSSPTATSMPNSGGENVPTLAGAGDTITVWFSDPLSGATSGGPENNLVAAIDGATKSIDVAIYNISLNNMSSALINAKKRGVNVRMVMESESMENRVPLLLSGAGIPIIGDQGEALMHNKFTIIDGKEVWMGSMNYTSTSAYNDFNNLVRFRSPQMAANYQSEFEEMFTDENFGPFKEANTPNAKVVINGVPVEVYFSPEDGVAEHVVAELLKAKKSIYFLAYSFTSNDFAEAILARGGAGVSVRGVFDESQNESNVGGEYAALKKAGFDIKLDGISGLMHDKVFIIDGQVVITGSYNFSQNAERSNDENLVIIRDRGIAALYHKHFEQVYGSAK